MSKEYNPTQINELKRSYAEGAEEFNIPVRSIYRYNNEMKRENPAPHVGNDGTATVAGTAEVETQATVCSVLPSEIQTIIVNYRQENPDHGYQRIEDYLRDRYFVKVSRKEIRKILKAHGLTKLLDSSFDKDQQPGNGTRRFEASQPGE
jgi:hypothetical protein